LPRLDKAFIFILLLLPALLLCCRPAGWPDQSSGALLTQLSARHSRAFVLDISLGPARTLIPRHLHWSILVIRIVGYDPGHWIRPWNSRMAGWWYPQLVFWK